MEKPVFLLKNRLQGVDNSNYNRSSSNVSDIPIGMSRPLVRHT